MARFLVHFDMNGDGGECMLTEEFDSLAAAGAEAIKMREAGWWASEPETLEEVGESEEAAWLMTRLS